MSKCYDLSSIENEDDSDLMQNSSAPKAMKCVVCDQGYLFDGLPDNNLDKLSICLHACGHTCH